MAVVPMKRVRLKEKRTGVIRQALGYTCHEVKANSVGTVISPNRVMMDNGVEISCNGCEVETPDEEFDRLFEELFL